MWLRGISGRKWAGLVLVCGIAPVLAPVRAAAQTQDSALNVRVQQAIAKAAAYLETNL